MDGRSALRQQQQFQVVLGCDKTRRGYGVTYELHLLGFCYKPTRPLASKWVVCQHVAKPRFHVERPKLRWLLLLCLRKSQLIQFTRPRDDGVLTLSLRPDSCSCLTLLVVVEHETLYNWASDLADFSICNNELKCINDSYNTLYKHVGYSTKCAVHTFAKISLLFTM